MPIIRAVLGGILVFFLPGYAWSFVIFRKINILERLAIAIGLSIALVTLSVLTLYVFFRVPINGLNDLINILVMTAVALIIYFIRRRRESRFAAPGGK